MDLSGLKEVLSQNIMDFSQYPDYHATRSPKDLDFQEATTDEEREVVKGFKKNVLLDSAVGIVILLVALIAMCLLTFGNIDFSTADTSGVALLITIIGVLLVLVFVKPVIALVAKAKICECEVVGTRVTRSHSTKHNRIHYQAVVAHHPTKTIVTAVELTKSQFKLMDSGDKAYVVKVGPFYGGYKHKD